MRQRNPLTYLPQDESFKEWLRYLVQSSDPDAPEMQFLVSLWAYCLRHNGLTLRQQKSLEPYIAEALRWQEETSSLYDYKEAQALKQHQIDASPNVVRFPLSRAISKGDAA